MRISAESFAQGSKNESANHGGCHSPALFQGREIIRERPTDMLISSAAAILRPPFGSDASPRAT